MVTLNLTNPARGPLKVVLDGCDLDFAIADAAGDDLRVVQEDPVGTFVEIAAELERFDPVERQAVLWVKDTPLFAPHRADEALWLYYGNPNPGPGPTGVFSAFEAVFHGTLNGDNAINTVSAASVPVGALVGGATDGAQGPYFTRSNGGVNDEPMLDASVFNDAVWQNQQGTVEFLFRPTNNNANEVLFGETGVANAVWVERTDVDQYMLHIVDDTGIDWGTAFYAAPGEWTNFSLSWLVVENNVNFRYFVDNRRESYGAATFASPADAMTAQRFVVGLGMNGDVDEIRLSDNVSSPVQLAFAALAMRNQVLDVQTAPPPPFPPSQAVPFPLDPALAPDLEYTFRPYQLIDAQHVLAQGNIDQLEALPTATNDQEPVIENGRVVFDSPGLLREENNIINPPHFATACDNAQELTVETWLSFETAHVGGPARVWGFSASTGSRGFSVVAQHGRVGLRLSYDGDVNGAYGGREAFATTVFEDRAPHHVVFVYSEGLIDIYVDGWWETSWGWADSFQLDRQNNLIVFGNEIGSDTSANQQRTFLGAVYTAAVYCQALDDMAVDVLYSAGTR